MFVSFFFGDRSGLMNFQNWYVAIIKLNGASGYLCLSSHANTPLSTSTLRP